MDMGSDKLGSAVEHQRFHYIEGDITINKEWIAYHIKMCDACLPLVAIATPATYVTDPLRVFHLDFEENLALVRQCAQYDTRVIFPSTSEVYGMCQDESFRPRELATWSTAPSTRSAGSTPAPSLVLDRAIYAMGAHEGLAFTLFRPFNWVGPGLDSIHAEKEGSSRVATQFLGQILRGESISLVDGGAQRRCFTDITDGVDCLMRIIANKDGKADGRIFNLGNPHNDLSVRELAEKLIACARAHPEVAAQAAKSSLVEVSSASFYGAGYQDMVKRKPSIGAAREALGWAPKVGTDAMLERTVAYYVREFLSRERSVYDHHLRGGPAAPGAAR